MENNGKLVVSTECNPTKKLGVMVLMIACAIILVYMTLDRDGLIAEMIKELDSEVWEWIIGGAVGFIAAGGIVDTYQNFKSYCTVYENAVTGTTRFNVFNKLDSLKTFTLNYNEITNISENKASIQIYTSYATFKVNAWDNCAAAAQEIRKRMSNGTVATPTPAPTPAPTPVAVKPVQTTQAPTTKAQTTKAQTTKVQSANVNHTPQANNTQTPYIGLNTQNKRIKK